MTDLTIFYDGGCPLCAREMRHLNSLDAASKIAYEDIYAANFTERFPHIDQKEADRILHGQLADGDDDLWSRCDLRSLGPSGQA